MGKKRNYFGYFMSHQLDSLTVLSNLLIIIVIIIIIIPFGSQPFHPCLHQRGAGTVNPACHVINLSCLTLHLSPAFSHDLASDWLRYLGDSGA